MRLKKKISDHNHDKYITIQELNKLTAENFAVRLPQVNLVTKTGFDNKLINFNEKLNSNKTKHVLVGNKFKKIQTFDSIYFSAKRRFEMMVLKII